MTQNIHIYYDEEGDFLEISLDDERSGTFKNLGDGIFERVNEKTHQVTGVAIHGFKEKTKNFKELSVPLP